MVGFDTLLIKFYNCYNLFHISHFLSRIYRIVFLFLQTMLSKNGKRSNESDTKWVVVQFLTEEGQPRSEVPTSWIIEEEGETFCYWPKNKFSVTSILKNPEKNKPNDEKFNCLLVKVIGREYGRFF